MTLAARCDFERASSEKPAWVITWKFFYFKFVAINFLFLPFPIQVRAFIKKNIQSQVS